MKSNPFVFGWNIVNDVIKITTKVQQKLHALNWVSNSKVKFYPVVKTIWLKIDL